MLKNVGKAAVKEGFKGAVKFGGKEVLKDMSKNAAFYGGSVALSEVGVDQKTQLTFMAAVTIVGHGKTAKAGIENFSARAQGVSKGSFLDALRVNDNAAYKKAMANLRELTYDKSVVLSCNGVGEIDKLFKNNKSLRGFIQKLNKMEVTKSQKAEIYNIFIDEDFDLQKKMKEYIECGSMEGIYNVIDTYQKRSKWRVHFSNEYSADNVLSVMDEMTLIKSVTKKLENYVDNMDDAAKDRYGKTAVAFDSKNLDTLSIATSNSHEYNPSILTEGEVFDKSLFEKLLSKCDGDESVAYSKYYENVLTKKYILNSISEEFFINKGLSRDKVIGEMKKLTDSIENTKNQAVEAGEFSQLTGNPSFEVWNVENCAEVWSTRKAILNGANFYDISFKCIETKAMVYAEPCKNCRKTFGKLNNIGEVKIDVR